MENWKDIPGTDYSVSDQGRVASRKYGRERILRPGPARGGYVMVILCVGIAKLPRRIHRLVAEAFIGPPPTPAHQVNHKDGDKLNNCADNLEWSTGSQNIRHSFDVLGRVGVHGEAHYRARLTEGGIRDMRERYARGETQQSIANEYGVSRAYTSQIINRVRWAWVS